MRTSLKTIFSFLLCFCLLSGAAVFGLPAEASVSISANATVSGDTVTAVFTFPDATFASVSVDVTYNTAHLKLSAEGTHTAPAGLMAALTPMATANGQGKCTFGVVGMADTSYNGASLTLVFHVEDASVTETTLTATVTKCKSANQADFALGGVSKTVTLKTVTPPPSSDSEGNGSTGVTDEGGSSDSSDLPVSSTGSGNAASSDTPSSGESDKPVSSDKTSSKAPSDTETSDTGTVTDSAEVSDTDSVLSSETDTATDLPLTESATDLTLSQNSDTAPSVGSTVSLGAQNPVSDKGSEGISTDTVILLVSIAVACCLCFCLTYLGLRRQAPKDPEEE